MATRVDYDLRGWMLRLSRILDKDSVGVSQPARVVVEDLVHYTLSSRTVGLPVETVLYQEHPMVIDSIQDGIENEELEDLINEIYDEFYTIIPKVDTAWRLRYTSDIVTYIGYTEQRISKPTTSELKRYLRKKETDEGVYVKDILIVIDEFEANRGFYRKR